MYWTKVLIYFSLGLLDEEQAMLDTKTAGPCRASLYGSAWQCSSDRLFRRRTKMAAAIATHPYSSSITQPGRAPQGWPSARKCHCTYTGMMLTLHTMINSVEADIRNGSNHSRYQGKTAGAHRRVAAIGQAKTSSDNSVFVLRMQVAVTSPASTTNATTNGGDAT